MQEFQEDQSPHVQPAAMRKELSATAEMNLTELSFALYLLSDELPQITAALQYERNATLKARGLFMAIAFEAGRRVGVKQATGVTLDPAVKRKLLELIEAKMSPSH